MSKAEQIIKESNSNGESVERITQKIYLIMPTHAFKDAEDIQLDLFSDISNYIKAPMSSIHIIGSAQTGMSLVKGTAFSKETSDIDIAIVEPYLYTRNLEHSFKISNGWSNLSTFSNKRTSSNKQREEFLRYLSKGIFRPDFMPNCSERADLLSFFSKLSDKYSNFCNGISSWIYASEYFLTHKQQSAIKKYISTKGMT